MRINSTIATTSSRLNREIELPPEVEAQKQVISDREYLLTIRGDLQWVMDNISC